MEPLWQNVQQEAPDERIWGERHRAKPRSAVAAVILVAKVTPRASRLTSRRSRPQLAGYDSFDGFCLELDPERQRADVILDRRRRRRLMSAKS